MTPAELKAHVSTGTESHFFERSSMRFFGDTMSNYGVRSATVRTQYDAAGNYTDAAGVHVDCWELYRRRPVKHGLRTSAYFDKVTFARIFPAREY